MTDPFTPAFSEQCRAELFALVVASQGTLDEHTTPESAARSVRQRIEDLEVEGRRLRRILSLLAAEGVGVGALVEVYRSPERAKGGPDGRGGEFFGVAVCRADRDEEAFTRDVMDAVRELVAVLGCKVAEGEPMERRGVTADKAEVSR